MRQDNGVKLVDPYGEMLEGSWEAGATLLANSITAEALIKNLDALIETYQINMAQPARVVYGHDTRPSCPSLVKSLEQGMKAWEGNCDAIPAGLVTTPQLHYLVRSLNTISSSDPFGIPTEEGYYEKLAKAFNTLSKGKAPLSHIVIDCANGVGGPKLRNLMEHIGVSNLSMSIVKDDTRTAGALNNQCGADYVKTQQKAPPGLELSANTRYCSLDGDADRIVFYYQAEDGAFRLLDGDKIASVSAAFFLDLVKQAGLELEVGVVQTAYANGSSTSYLSNVLVSRHLTTSGNNANRLAFTQKVPVACVPTGVKHLHHAATRYDIGVYFEANGHGTVLFSPEARQTIHSTDPTSPNQLNALNNLKALMELINQTVGDALSDLLLVETILMHRQWTPKEWDSAYTDLPNRLVKVVVPDRNAFTTQDAERTLVTPRGLQNEIDKIVAKFAKGRSFVRPSGTEDCVRVYAEAATGSEADGKSLQRQVSTMLTYASRSGTSCQPSRGRLCQSAIDSDGR